MHYKNQSSKYENNFKGIWNAIKEIIAKKKVISPIFWDRLWETYSHLKDAAKGAKILLIKTTLNLKVRLTHRTLTGLTVQG